MAALTFLALYAGQQLFRVGSVFLDSGFSIKKTFEFAKAAHNEYLFERYLREFNAMSSSDKSDIKVWKSASLEYDFDDIDGDFYDDIEIVDGVEATEVDSSFYDEIVPNEVYSNSDLGEIKEGVSLTVNGYILQNCERLSINLIVNTPTRDIALHINPRLPQNYIVRNCRIKNRWGIEEVTSPLPFCLRRGKKFSIQILIIEEEFLISINGRHFASFKHRLPYNRITCLEVKGDVEKITFERSEIEEYPIKTEATTPNVIETHNRAMSLALMYGEPNSLVSLENKSFEMPYYGTLSHELTDGSLLNIRGRVKILPHSFFVNLQVGQNIWPHPLIAFHFNPRFANVGGKHIICSNSWIDGKWDKEERFETRTDFLPGKTFILSIYCSENAYEVFLNRKLISEYKFRTKPEQVDTVYIQGDIILWEVSVETGIGSEIYDT